MDNYAVQVSGRLRGAVAVAADADEAAVLEAARAAVREHLEGRRVIREIVVPRRIVNFVVR